MCALHATLTGASVHTGRCYCRHIRSTEYSQRGLNTQSRHSATSTMDSSDLENSAHDVKEALTRKADEAGSLVSDGISKIRSKMASSGKTYPPPCIPVTPSNAINKMLDTRFSKPFDNPIKYAVAVFVCTIFTVIVRLYGMIHPGTRPSHSKWMTSCALVSVCVILGTIILYYVAVAMSIILYSLLYYGCILLALAGVGIGVSGAVFFDKDGSKQSPGFESKSE